MLVSLESVSVVERDQLVGDGVREVHFESSFMSKLTLLQGLLLYPFKIKATSLKMNQYVSDMRVQRFLMVHGHVVIEVSVHVCVMTYAHKNSNSYKHHTLI